MKKNDCALISTDQSVAYDIICHSILKRKIEHIGFSKSAVNIIMNYLRERKQYVQINTNNSDILITGPQSVSQGSVISGTLYAIYTCDMHYVTHMTKHSSHTEYEKCTKSYINTYVDDAFCIVQTQNEDLWDQISNLIKK